MSAEQEFHPQLYQEQLELDIGRYLKVLSRSPEFGFFSEKQEQKDTVLYTKNPLTTSQNLNAENLFSSRKKYFHEAY